MRRLTRQALALTAAAALAALTACSNPDTEDAAPSSTSSETSTSSTTESTTSSTEEETSEAKAESAEPSPTMAQAVSGGPCEPGTFIPDAVIAEIINYCDGQWAHAAAANTDHQLALQWNGNTWANLPNQGEHLSGAHCYDHQYWLDQGAPEEFVSNLSQCDYPGAAPDPASAPQTFDHPNCSAGNIAFWFGSKGSLSYCDGQTAVVTQPHLDAETRLTWNDATGQWDVAQ